MPVVNYRAWVFSSLLCSTVLQGGASAPNSDYALRRARLVTQARGPIVLFGNTEPPYSLGVAAFHQEENFFYLTGHNEPSSALLLIPRIGTPAEGTERRAREILFVPAPNKAWEMLYGPRIDSADPDLTAQTGFQEVKPFSALQDELQNAVKDFPILYTISPVESEPDNSLGADWVMRLKGSFPFSSIRNIADKLATMRQTKSQAELERIRSAALISVEAHRDAMSAVIAGMYEYQIAAAMKYTAERAGCNGSHQAITVASGKNSQLPHYHKNERKLEDGDLVVIDFGAMCAGYAADIARTVPVGGQFSWRQREIYEIVLGAQERVLESIKPGMNLGLTGNNSLYRIAFEYIDSHGKDTRGNSLGRYFIHGIGHHVGLSVHDPGDVDRPLTTGMVVTIEPGIYLPDEGIGVRLEDMVLITQEGGELLTGLLPRRVDDIERIVSAPRK